MYTSLFVCALAFLRLFMQKWAMAIAKKDFPYSAMWGEK